MGIEEALVKEFGRMNKGDRAMTVADATLLYAARRFEQVQLAHDLDEECITAALFGSLSASFPLCAEIVGTDVDAATECYWSQFKKTKVGATTPNPHHHESVSGADFALALRIGDDRLRVAFFQAKRAEPESSSFDTHRRVEKPPSQKPWRVAQIVQLFRRGREIMRALGRGVPNKSGDPLNGLNQLTWIHYVVYYEQLACCVPLAELADAVRKEDVDLKVNENLVELSPRHPQFVDVLFDGLSKTSHWWTEMTWEEADRHLPHLIPLSNLLIIDESRGSGGALGLSKGRAEKLSAQSKAKQRRLEQAQAKPPRWQP